VGPQGPTGEKGAAGPQGERGEPGPRGERGEKGDDGAAGPQGETGPRGEKGDPGDPGVQGERGEKGDTGAAGAQGDPGPRGEKGERGDVGERGEDGRDAAALEILPAIGVGRAYARKTYASHNGGLWCSMRKTDPLPDEPTAEQVQAAGWTNIVEGRASVEIEKRGRREIVVRETSCTGRVTEMVMRFPVALYDGVYDESKDDYEVGDLRTWGGSIWHCNVDGTKEKPSHGTSDWTLAVKRGHNGKDFVPPAPAAPAQQVRLPK